MLGGIVVQLVDAIGHECQVLSPFTGKLDCVPSDYRSDAAGTKTVPLSRGSRCAILGCDASII